MTTNRLAFSFLGPNASLTRTLRQFPGWWLREFLALFPEPALEWLRGARQKILVIEALGEDVRLELLDDLGRVQATEHEQKGTFSTTNVDRFLTTLNLERTFVSVGLRLPIHQIFCRRLVLPIQAERQLDQIAMRDLAAKTPFRISDVYVGSAAKPEHSSKTINVAQWVVLRRIVNDAASELKIDLEDLDFVEAPHQQASAAPNIPLRTTESGKMSRFARAVVGLAVSALLLAMINTAATYWQQQSTLDALDAKIAPLRVKAQKVRAEIEKLEQHRSTVTSLLTRKATGPGFLDLWDETTRLLPAHSWLTEFRLSQLPNDNVQQISMIGYSSAAATLVGLVDESGLFTEASLTSPVTLDPTQGRERFSLQAKLRKPDTAAKGHP